MDCLVRRIHRIVTQILVPNGLFGLEVVERVVRQLIKNNIECRQVRLKSHVAGQFIQQLNELFVLFINHRNIGVEVVIPREYIDRIHGSLTIRTD